jgi:hypothetical protein
MIVRNPNTDDLEQIERIHRDMGMDYSLPQLDHPLFIVRKVTTDGEGNVLGACFLRLTAETYLWLDPKIDARQKVHVMETMQPVVISEAYNKGLDDIEARIPESIETRFRKRLERLGWTKNRSGWFPWSRQTHA